VVIGTVEFSGAKIAVKTWQYNYLLKNPVNHLILQIVFGHFFRLANAKVAAKVWQCLRYKVRLPVSQICETGMQVTCAPPGSMLMFQKPCAFRPGKKKR
jgi:hypothetical protein